MLRRRPERQWILWFGICILSMTSSWLHRKRISVEKQLEWQIELFHQRRRYQHTLESDNDEEQNALDMENGDRPPSRPADTLMMRLVSAVRNMVFWAWICNFVTAEISELYLENQTGAGKPFGICAF